jgi:hypothetical protein
MLYIACSYSTATRIFFIRHFFSTTTASTSTFPYRRSNFQRNRLTSFTKQFPRMSDGTIRSYTHTYTKSFINFEYVINCNHDLFRCRFREARKIRGLSLTLLAATHFHCLLREINTVNVDYDRCWDFIFFSLESTSSDEYSILIIRMNFFRLDINSCLRYEFDTYTCHYLGSACSFVLYKYRYSSVD